MWLYVVKINLNPGSDHRGQAQRPLSDIGGFSSINGAIGPSLSAIPGSVFLKLVVGRTDNAGQWSLTGTWPNDTNLLGTSWILQAAVAGDDNKFYLSNAITRNCRGVKTLHS